MALRHKPISNLWRIKMKRWLWILPVIILSSVIVVAFAAEKKESQEGKGLLRHFVSFKFKENTTPEQIKTVEDAFKALPQKIDCIADFEMGTNVSPEKLNKGFTHCFLLAFKTAKDRDAYLVHPAHKEFGKTLGTLGCVDDIVVLDFWNNK